MRIIVTGGAGFIGSHLVEMIASAGHEVTVVDDLSSGQKENLPPQIPLIVADITTKLDMQELFRDVRPDAVINCAAQTSVKRSVEDPMDDLERNLVGTVNLLESSRLVGTGLFIQPSSAAVYGTPRFMPLTEEHPTQPLSPYGLSKLAAETYVQSLGERYGMRWVIFRYSNIFGPRQKAGSDGAVLPNFLTAMVAGVDPVIHGDGEQTRDFVYVKDVCEANLLALQADCSGIFHISTGQAITINHLWRLAAFISGWERPPCYGSTRPGDIRHSVLNPARAMRELGWQSRADLESALRLTAQSCQDQGVDD